MNAAPAPAAIESLRIARDKAQRDYAHAKQRVVSGQGSRAEHERTRSAYMLAQSEYRAALLAAKAAGGAR